SACRTRRKSPRRDRRGGPAPRRRGSGSRRISRPSPRHRPRLRKRSETGRGEPAGQRAWRAGVECARGPRVYQAGAPMISAVVVSYRSAGLAARALESLRWDAAKANLTLETIAVVNSGDPEEARALASAADRVVDPGRNLGFAGGLNAGIGVARGEILVLANPDVVVRAGALAALAAEARGTLVAAGPALFLDDGETLHLPPAAVPARAAGGRRDGAPGDSPRERPLGGVRRRVAADARTRRAFRRGLRPLLRGERLAAAPEDGRGPAVTRRCRAPRPPLQPERPARAARRGLVRDVRAPLLRDAFRRARPARARRSRGGRAVEGGRRSRSSASRERRPFLRRAVRRHRALARPGFRRGRARSARLGRLLAAAGRRQARLRRRHVVRTRRGRRDGPRPCRRRALLTLTRRRFSSGEGGRGETRPCFPITHSCSPGFSRCGRRKRRGRCAA